MQNRGSACLAFGALVEPRGRKTTGQTKQFAPDSYFRTRAAQHDNPDYSALWELKERLHAIWVMQ